MSTQTIIIIAVVAVVWAVAFVVMLSHGQKESKFAGQVYGRQQG